MAEKIKSLLPEKNSETNYKTLYSEIILTEEETDIALYEARKAKDARLRLEAYKAKLLEVNVLKFDNAGLQKYVIGKHTATGKDFVQDQWNKEIFDMLTLYFNNDPMFERAGYSLKKGIMIQGPVGCGKTVMLRLFQQNPKGSFIFAACDKIAAKFSEGGFAEVERYCSPIRLQVDQFGHTQNGIFFDDLGTDREKKYYGNESNVLEEVIMSWYNKLDQFPERIHFTTNLSFDEIEQKYGSRVRSRMREMFNVFQFSPDAPDRRK